MLSRYTVKHSNKPKQNPKLSRFPFCSFRTLQKTLLENHRPKKNSGRSEGRNFFYERKGGLGDNGGLFGPVGVGKFCSLSPQKGMVEPLSLFF